MVSRRPSRADRSAVLPDPSLGVGPVGGSPAAVRTTQTRWRDPRLALGIAVVALCGLVGARLLASADDSVSVWAVRAGLQAGQPVGAADLMRRQVRFGDQVDADRYLSAGSAVPAGATVDRAVGAGELLPRSALFDAATRVLTQVPLSVPSDAVPATVRIGSTVDIWVTPRAESPGARTRPTARRSTLVFHDVQVVSAPRTGSSLGATSTRQVVVGVGADQDARLSRSLAALAGGDVLVTAPR